MIYAVTHRTTYAYESAVSISHHVAHLRPRELPQQQVQDFALEVSPVAAVLVPRTDYFGNEAAFFALEAPHKKLVVTATSRVRVERPSLPSETPAWETVRDRRELLTPAEEAGNYCFGSPLIPTAPEFADYAAGSFLPGQPLLVGLRDFTQRIFRDFKFDARATTVSTPVSEVFKKRRGVCQDFAHLGIACLRSLGLPARYVSGYLETLPPPGKARLVGADASHAWFSVWCPGHGWIDADPTNNVLPGERHVTVAWGRDFRDVSPLRGVVVGGGKHRLRVSVDVAPQVE